jgi:hypothetical protein
MSSCAFPFQVDRLAILSFDHAIKSRTFGDLYLSYAFLSPHSTNKNISPSPSKLTIHRHLDILQGLIHSRLDGPGFFNTIPHLPPSANHFRVTLPFTNDMEESLDFLIEGVSVSLLLGERSQDNILTLRHLGYLIFLTIRALHSTLPPNPPFPPKLARFTSRFDISRIILVKKVRFGVSPTTSRRSGSTPNPAYIRPLLGIVLSKTAPFYDHLRDAIHHACVKNSAILPICGSSSDRLSLRLHPLTKFISNQVTTAPDHHILARRIDAAHNPLFDTTKFKIIRHVPIHVNILLKGSFLLNAINSFGNCFGILLDFSHGIGAPLLTCIFRATRAPTHLLDPTSLYH